jgi:sensor histidine kinase YesM
LGRRHHIARPLQAFQDHISAYAKDRKPLSRRGFAELNEAATVFDDLVRQIEELKIDIYEEKLLIARTELEYFQLQIKPHFFVNCFSVIHAMAQKKDFPRIQEFCIKLSSYVRCLLTDGLSMMTVSDELSMVRDYLDIQKIRSRTQTLLCEDTDPAIMARRIPPLILLTFVENSVRHARRGTEELTVSIDLSRREEDGAEWLCFTVCDNGPGFSGEQLELLNDAERLDSIHCGDGRSLGIRNIYKRLALIYGERFSLSFSNTAHGGKVSVTVPGGEVNAGDSKSLR